MGQSHDLPDQVAERIVAYLAHEPYVQAELMQR